VFRIGNDKASERWLCEGYATALSLRAALNDLRRSAQAIVCFSAGNIMHVAPRIRKPAYIMADHDANGVGAAAAVAAGLPWVMPAEVGTDANDVHQRAGLRALVKLIQSEWSESTVREMRAMQA
jgi:putative DNA primase/helicase